MNNPTTVNQAASAVNLALKQLIEGAGSQVVETTLIAQYPWLGLPVVKQIFEFALEKVSGLIYQQAANAATKVVIDFQVSGEKSNVYKTFQNLQTALLSKDEKAIAQASKDLDDAYARLIHSDGSASP